MRTTAINILRTLHAHDFTALFVGGCVRDMLMGKAPEDYDIVTDAAPDQIAALFKRTLFIGAQFGIVIVVSKGKTFEVAQLRQSSPDTPNRLQADAFHRDFTINGMFHNPLTDQVYDYVGGQHDIERRVIRAIGNPHDRFLEDKLRMMRAIRFAISYDYAIDPTTATAIHQHAGQISDVSVERIREELLHILLSPHPDQGIRWLAATHLLDPILPEVAALKGVSQPPDSHPEGDVFTHTLLMLNQLRTRSPELAMAVLLHDIGKPPTYTQTDRIRFHRHAQVGARMAEVICGRLKFSTKSTEKIVALVQDHLKFFDVPRMKQSTLKRLLRQDHFPELLELYRLDCLSSDRDLGIYEFCRRKCEEFRHDSIRPPRLLSGNDLIRLGMTPGPVFKQLLEYLEDAQLEGTISTKREAIDFVKEIQATLSSC
ncbi:HD domain-containing protein [candidate division KSB3 bacterium]|uniref:HD domain-containing protein n=1 Tax=candidate division KSB3 bacterium TaxID=2044937 RepID=A0A9D5K0R1_9BACT|nr:HD domain-containing protein [candidate division KSB3 bacterium]MBD3327217.1 HD domain-containing protein [candidate division KSB3 bacterium]